MRSILIEDHNTLGKVVDLILDEEKINEAFGRMLE